MKLILAAFLLLNPVHHGPWTYTPVVHVGNHREVTSAITFHGDACRGRTTGLALLEESGDGGENLVIGYQHGNHYSFPAQYNQGDIGRVYNVIGWYGTCPDGSTVAYGDTPGGHAIHPAITIEK